MKRRHCIMKLAVINGSPRGEKSNSNRMTQWIFQQEDTNNQIDYNTFFLYKTTKHVEYMEDLSSYDSFLFVFPLYVDSMPAITKAFFDLMAENKGIFEGKPVHFIIHSGFPEMVQSLSLKRYITYFSSKLMNMDYKGTLIMAGSEALQSAPDGYFGKKLSIFRTLYKTLLNAQNFNESLSYQLSSYYQLNMFQKILFTINPLKDFYWNYVLKKNNAKKKVNDAPYKNVAISEQMIVE